MDTLTPEQRSRNMSLIRSKDSLLELRVRRLIHSMGFRFRLHVRTLPGTPDIVLPRWSAVVQVHGCFWHPHARCAIASTPGTNVEFWGPKLEGNRQRDIQNTRNLRRLGWRVFTVRECGARNPERLREKLERFLKNGGSRVRVSGMN